MKNLYKVSCRKIYKNTFYKIGLIIAAVVTYIFTAGYISLGQIIDTMPLVQKMIFIGAAMIPFFTIFPPIIICSEYGDGVMKNKVISGYSQKQIFLGGMLAQLSACAFMWIIHVIAGIIAGVRPDGKDVLSMLAMLLAVLAYTAVIYAITFRLRKPVRSFIVDMLLLNACYNVLIFGNLLGMYLKGFALKILALVYNANAMGQWFVLNGLADEDQDPGRIPQIILSVLLVGLAVLIGTMKVNKRDLV